MQPQHPGGYGNPNMPQGQFQHQQQFQHGMAPPMPYHMQQQQQQLQQQQQQNFYPPNYQQMRPGPHNGPQMTHQQQPWQQDQNRYPQQPITHFHTQHVVVPPQANPRYQNQPPPDGQLNRNYGQRPAQSPYSRSITVVSSIPPNPYAGAPLTLWIGKIPSTVGETLILKLLEVFGGVQKWNRPVDSAGTPKAFGFCTFDFGISALRCKSLFCNIDFNNPIQSLQAMISTQKRETKNSLRQVLQLLKKEAKLFELNQKEKEKQDELQRKYESGELEVSFSVDKNGESGDQNTENVRDGEEGEKKGKENGQEKDGSDLLEEKEEEEEEEVESEVVVEYIPDPSLVPLFFEIKAGTKEQLVLDSLEKTEKDNLASLPPTTAPHNPNTAICVKLVSVLQLPDSGFADKNAENISHSDTTGEEKTEKMIIKKAKNGTFNENTIGFDGTLQRTDMESFGVFGAEKETVILTEIEKFRIRQGIRDKEVEELRKMKLKEKIKELGERQARLVSDQKKKEERDEREEREGKSDSVEIVQDRDIERTREDRDKERNVRDKERGSERGERGRDVPKRGREREELSGEDEAMRRKRRQQVLEMLSESYSKTETGNTETTELPEINHSDVHGNENDQTELENGEEIQTENSQSNFTNIPAMPIFSVLPKQPIFVPPMPIFSVSKIGVSDATEMENTETENFGQNGVGNSAAFNADHSELEKKEVKFSSMKLTSKAINKEKIFSYEEKEEKKKRKLILIDYSEEEKQAALSSDYGTIGKEGEGGGVSAKVQAIAQSMKIGQAEKAKTEKVEKVENKEDLKKKKLKEIVDQIPTKKELLFVYPVDWNIIEQEKIIDNTMKSWTLKKMFEYLGEEEHTLTDFIISKLRKRCLPVELLTELRAVLDEDADHFVVKLWRMLIYSATVAASTSITTSS